MALFDSSKRNKEARISPVSKRFTPLQQTQYHSFSQMPVHSSYLFHIQSVPSVFPVAPLCTDMHSFPNPPAFHCQKAYWLYQGIPILQAYIFSTNILYGSLFSFHDTSSGLCNIMLQKPICCSFNNIYFLHSNSSTTILYFFVKYVSST